MDSNHRIIELESDSRESDSFVDFEHDDSDEDIFPSTTISRRKSRHHPLIQQFRLDANESADYRTPDDDIQRFYYKTENHKVRNMQKVVGKWFIFFLVGVITGSIAFGIKKSIDILQEFKSMSIETLLEEGKTAAAFFAYWGICTLYALAGGAMVLICGPLSGGSGIPEVKGFLNGVVIHGVINIKTFIGKVVSIIFSFSSCLALGPEGPMVHIGSMIGGGLSSGKSKTLHLRLPRVFEVLRTDKEQRDFVSSGAAAGIAAAFGAPIGGVLFALEETSSFWSRELTWRTFFGTMVASFTVNGFFKLSEYKTSYVDDYGLLTFGLSSKALYRYEELIVFAILGIIGGLLGALFVKLNISLNRWRRDNLRKKGWMGLTEILILVTLCSIITFTIPLATSTTQCRSIAALSNKTVDNVYDTKLTLNLSSTFCQSKELYNDYTNLFMIPQDRALKNLFSRTHDVFSTHSLLVFLFVYFIEVIVTAGILNAGGLFVPMMLIGATYGRVIGRVLGRYYEEIDPSIYALVGSAAMMSGFSRSTISLVVIVVELTANTQFMLPIMLAVMLAKWVGDLLGESIYEELMELKSIAFLKHHPPRITMSMGVNDVMETDVRCINETEGLDKVVELLRSTSHNAFPVVKDYGIGRQATYKGLITRRQILVLLQQRKYQRKDQFVSNHSYIDHETNITLLNRKIALDDVGLPSQSELPNFLIDFLNYTDKSAPITTTNASFVDAYRMFCLLGLRHLVVLNDNFQVSGMITRHNLLQPQYDEHVRLLKKEKLVKNGDDRRLCTKFFCS